MKEKLTLSIDKKIKEKVMKFARVQGKSISQMVETYLESLFGEESRIQLFGKQPVNTGVQDVSEQHDRYIYSSAKWLGHFLIPDILLLWNRSMISTTLKQKSLGEISPYKPLFDYIHLRVR